MCVAGVKWKLVTHGGDGEEWFESSAPIRLTGYGGILLIGAEYINGLYVPGPLE